MVTVDTIILHGNKLALIKRKNEPFRGLWALPGGFVEHGEEPWRAAIREAKEETNLDVVLKDKKRACVYGNPKRDPRGHLVSLVYAASAKNPENIRGGGDTAEARFFSKEEIPKNLAADHRRIIKDVLGW